MLIFHSRHPQDGEFSVRGVVNAVRSRIWNQSRTWAWNPVNWLTFKSELVNLQG